jgi:flagellar biosynthetic protein FliP
MTFRRRVGRPAQILPPLILVMVLATVTSPTDARAEPSQRVQSASVALDAVTLPPAAAASPAEPALLPAIAPSPALEQSPAPQQHGSRAESGDASAVSSLVSKVLGGRSLDATLSAAVMFGVASLAPAVLLMTTCFVRMSIVLSLVRQGLGTPQLPSNQILTSLALFLSALVMWPVWTAAYRDGVEPYQQGRIELATAYEQGTLPVRRWMATQIEQSGNRDTMLYFLSRHPTAPKRVATYDDVPVETLLPAFLVSELKTAFAIGFRLLLPFLVLDVLVATLVVSTGLVMLPPTLVSLPLKLMVFVAADGWSLVVRSLLDGVRHAAP